MFLILKLHKRGKATPPHTWAQTVHFHEVQEETADWNSCPQLNFAPVHMSQPSPRLPFLQDITVISRL